MQWYQGPIQSAIAEAKVAKKIFLVFIEGDDEASKFMTESFNSDEISECLKNDCVAIKLQTSSDQFKQFSQIYPVVVVPSSFFISFDDGIPLEVVGGKQSVAEFKAKIEKTLILHRNKVSKYEETNVGHSVQDSVANSASGSDSTEIINDKVERAKQLIEERRAQKAREQQEEDKRKEIEKRKAGRELQKFKEEQQKKEMLNWAQERQKEKQEDKLARERIKAQIAQDRADRAARFQNSTTPNPERVEPAEAAAPPSAPPSSSNSNVCRIQFRLPDASTRTYEFEASDKMNSVFGYVQRVIGFSNVILATTFPRRQFTKKANGPSTLRELELTPSAVLIIIPNSGISGTSLSTGGGAGGIFSIIYTILTPLFLIWNFLLSFLGRGQARGPSTSSVPAQSVSNPRNTSPESSNRSASPTLPPGLPPGSRSSGASESSRASASGSANSSPSSHYSRREGNIHRLANERPDDDEKTYNGNSTQQL